MSLHSGQDLLGADCVANFQSLPCHLVRTCFSYLGPRDLASSSSTCVDWNQQVAHCGWDAFYLDRWPFPSAPPSALSSWQTAFNTRMGLASCWRIPQYPRPEELYGHLAHGGVKVCKLFGASQLFTGGIDRRIIAWDLGSGSRIAVSPAHAGTVRCLATNSELFVSGSTDHRIRVWKKQDKEEEEEEEEEEEDDARHSLVFDIAGSRATSSSADGHMGAVTAVQLTSNGTLISGGWDYTLRVWDAEELRCTQILPLQDWVSDAKLMGQTTLCVACPGGAQMHKLTDKGTLSETILTVSCGDGKRVDAVAGTEDSRLLLYGDDAGQIVAVDIRCGYRQVLCTLTPAPNSPRGDAVTAMVFEYPWLAVTGASGNVYMVDLEELLTMKETERQVNVNVIHSPALKGSAVLEWKALKHYVPVRRMPQYLLTRTQSDIHVGAISVDLQDGWLAVGMSNGTVVTYNGREALNRRREVEKARALKAKMRIVGRNRR